MTVIDKCKGVKFYIDVKFDDRVLNVLTVVFLKQVEIDEVVRTLVKGFHDWILEESGANCLLYQRYSKELKYEAEKMIKNFVEKYYEENFNDCIIEEDKYNVILNRIFDMYIHEVCNLVYK